MAAKKAPKKGPVKPFPGAAAPFKAKPKAAPKKKGGGK
jgi:hypothetical protein